MSLLDRLNYIYRTIMEKIFGRKVNSNLLLSEKNDETYEEINLDENEENNLSAKNDTSFISQNSLIDDINSMRVKLSRIEIVCPNEYVDFNLRLDALEKECKEEYESFIKAMTSNELVFTCNPLYNRALQDKIRKIQVEIDDFISNEAQYKLLSNRFTKLYTEILKYYNQYINGTYKGSFRDCISQANSKLAEVITRVIGDGSFSSSSFTDFINKKNLSDIYANIFYILQKCTIRYSIKHNLTYDYKKDFKSEYLVPLMKDLEQIGKKIESFKSSRYYDELKEKYNRIKSINISNLETFLKNDEFFDVLLSIEDLLVSAVNSIDKDKLKTKSDELLKILTSSSTTKSGKSTVKKTGQTGGKNTSSTQKKTTNGSTNAKKSTKSSTKNNTKSGDKNGGK